jgi:hypothetical protein
MRPKKLRFVVEAQTSPSASTPFDMPRQAAAGGIGDAAAGLHEDLDEALREGLREYGGRRGGHDGPHRVGAPLPAEHGGGFPEVLDPAVRAGADIDLVLFVPASSRMD